MDQTDQLPLLSTVTMIALIDGLFILSVIVDGSALYRAFLLREFSNENLEFWVAVEEYRLLKPQKMANKAQQVYNDFIAIQAPKEVNILSMLDFKHFKLELQA